MGVYKPIHYIFNGERMDYELVVIQGRLSVDDIFDKLRGLRERLKDDYKYSIIQIIDPSLILPDYLVYSYMNVLFSYENKINISPEPSNEFLLWMAGDNNFDTAINDVGVKDLTGDVGLILILPANRFKEENFSHLFQKGYRLNKLGFSVDLSSHIPEVNIGFAPGEWTPLWERQVMFKLSRLKPRS